MNLLSYIYLLLTVLLIIALAWVSFTLKVRAKSGRFRVIAGLILAALTIFGMLYLSIDLAAKISSLFIIVAFLTIALWPKGLSNWGVISSLRVVKPYALVSSVVLTHDKKQQTVATFHFGAMQIVKLTFKTDLNEIYNFLDQHQVRSIEIQ
ncbi:hypothetical protein ACFQ5M_10790 [Agrilactobacillus yilanensis]|uniref:LaaL n=1 Tax=Agrilactobacillus yilanensis TaxID=2485997 RepID=A0ABW4JA97_9LACO|nr:hypothetical protein [Agrilactobacillus yilanensis]